MHTLCEHGVGNNVQINGHDFEKQFSKDLTTFAAQKFFINLFKSSNISLYKQELDKYLNEFYENHFKHDLLKSMFIQGKELAPLIIPELEREFGNFKVISIEEYIKEDITEFTMENYLFRGYSDLVIELESGKKIIIDYKTTSWGWDAKKKSDPMVTYQLTLYKHFLCKKYGWNPKDVETYFVLIKRTAKKNRVEILRITSGKRKTENSLKFMNNVLYNIEKEMFLKVKKDCRWCPFYKINCNGK